jgi:hypothetical protein
MIEQKTLLILGAGSSIEYGYPSGSNLVSNIKNSFENEVKEIANSGFHENELFPNIYTFQETAKKFADAVREANPYSIDLFMSRNHPNFDNIGSFAIALNIMKKERSSFEGDFNVRFTTEDKWQEYLFNNLCSDHYANNIEEILPFKTSYLTFNYDRSFEYSGYRYFKSNYLNCKKERLMVNLSPKHIYGQVNEGLDIEGYGFQFGFQHILNSAKSIRVMYRNRNTLKNVLTEYEGYINRFQRIIFLGFGFDNYNLNVLEFPEVIKNREIKIYASVKGLPKGKKDSIASAFKSKVEKYELFDGNCRQTLEQII